MSDFSPETDLLVAAFQPLPLAVVITDVRGIICSVNAALTSLTGFTAEDAVGQPVKLLSFGAGDRDLHDVIREGIHSHQPWRGEWVWRRKNGNPFTAVQTLTSVECPNGEALVVVTVQNLDEGRQLTPRPPEAEEQAAGGGTWGWNHATGQIEGSSEWLKLHGRTPPCTVRNWEDFGSLLHPEDGARIVSQITDDLENRSPHLSMKYRVLLPDGQIRWIGASGRCTYDRS